MAITEEEAKKFAAEIVPLMPDWMKRMFARAFIYGLIKKYATKRRLPRYEVLCRQCGNWHSVGYGKKVETGEETNLIMAYTCGENSFLCGVAGKPIDGNQFRAAQPSLSGDGETARA